jgi:hypothetical protein
VNFQFFFVRNWDVEEVNVKRFVAALNV